MADSSNPIPFPDKADTAPALAPKLAPLSSADRLAGAREKLLGKSVLLHNGEPETGIGSAFHALSPENKSYLASLQSLIDAEDERDAAETALAAAEEKLAGAQARAAAAEPKE